MWIQIITVFLVPVPKNDDLSTSKIHFCSVDDEWLSYLSLSEVNYASYRKRDHETKESMVHRIMTMFSQVATNPMLWL